MAKHWERVSNIYFVYYLGSIIQNMFIISVLNKPPSLLTPKRPTWIPTDVWRIYIFGERTMQPVGREKGEMSSNLPGGSEIEWRLYVYYSITTYTYSLCMCVIRVILYIVFPRKNLPIICSELHNWTLSTLLQKQHDDYNFSRII